MPNPRAMLIDDATVERCAAAGQAALGATIRPGQRTETPTPQQWRTITRAVLTEALRPTPDPAQDHDDA